MLPCFGTVAMSWSMIMTSHGKKFLCGTDYITVADCKLAHIYYGTIYNDDFIASTAQRQEMMAPIDKFPNAKRYLTTTLKTAIAPYLATRVSIPF